MVRQSGFFRTLTPSVHGGVDAAELARFGLTADDVVDFSSNQSPIGASPRVADALAGAVIDAYPDRDARPLVAALAAHHGVMPAQVIAGNGSTELIRLIAQLALHPGARALAITPTFGEYAVATELTGADFVELPLVPEDEFRLDLARFRQTLDDVKPTLCWWCAPNNPTGTVVSAAEIARIVTDYPATLFVLDEAYCDLLPEPQWSPALLAHGNVLVLRSMTKLWGLAGVRLGYAIGDAALLAPLLEAKPPWNVNACAQAAGLAALADAAHYANALALLRAEKAYLVDSLRAQGWRVTSSAAAFFLVQVGEANDFRRRLLPHGILVRDCTSFTLPDYIRISPRHPAHNRKLVTAMEAIRETM